MKNFFLNKRYIFPLLLFGVVLVVYWQTLDLFIAKDDWDLFFQITRSDATALGTGPYRYAPTIFFFLYPFLDFNIRAYFFLGLVFRFLAALSLFLLVFELSKKKSIAMGVSFLFAAIGYIGLETGVHVQHLYAMMGTILFSCLSLWFLIKHFKTGSIIFYILSILIFSFTSEFFVLRAHGLIFLVIFLTLLFVDFKKNIKKVFIAFCKLVPFLLIYNHQYSAIYSRGGDNTFGSALKIFSDPSSFAFLINFPATFANGIVPDTIISALYKILDNSIFHLNADVFLLILSLVGTFWIIRKTKRKFLFFSFVIIANISFLLFSRWAFSQPSLASFNSGGLLVFTAFLGEGIGLILFLIFLQSWKNRNIESRLLLFGFLWFFSQYIGYFVASPTLNLLVSTQRYMTASSVGASLILGTIVFFNGFRKINSLVFLIVLSIFIFTVNGELARIAQHRNPTRQLYKDIKNQMPILPKNPVLFFDYESDPQLIDRVKDSYPSTALSLFYGLPDQVKMVSTLDELLIRLSEKKTQIDNIVTFYVSRNGVENTTPIVRKILSGPSIEKEINASNWSSNTQSKISVDAFTANPLILEKRDGTLGVNSQLKAKINATSVGPMLLSVTLSALPLQFGGISFPYQDVTSKMLENVTIDDLEVVDIDSREAVDPSCDKRLQLLEEEKQHRDFLRTVKVSAPSEYEYADNRISNIIDGKYNTDWTLHPLDWNKKNNVEIIVDLGAVKPITRFHWVNHFKRTTPVEYSILALDNNNTWKEIKSVKNGEMKPDDAFVAEQLLPTQAQYVKMVITATVSGLSPSLKEIWVDAIRDMGNLGMAQELIQLPFSCPVFSEDEASEIIKKVGSVRARLSLKTNAGSSFTQVSDFYIIPDGVARSHFFYLPAKGTVLEEIKIDAFQIPLNVTITQTSIRSLSLKETEELGYVSSAF